MRHFNSGSVFGRVIECKEEKSSKDKPYLSLKVQVSGEKSGSATAFCRIWGEERCREFLDLQNKNPGPLVLRGMMTSYRDDKNCFYSNFTCFSWEPKVAEPRAVFILRGEVDVVSGTTDGGQRMLLKVTRMPPRVIRSRRSCLSCSAKGKRCWTWLRSETIWK